MRAARLLLLILCSLPLAGQQRDDRTEAARAEAARAEAARADAAFDAALSRARSEKKPVVIFFQSATCARCGDVERISLAHPAIQRRLGAVVFAVLPGSLGEAARAWHSDLPGVAFFDRTGSLRARWPIVPDTTNLGIILDSVITVAPQFERAVEMAESGRTGEAAVESAIGLGRLGFVADARLALDCARAEGSPAARQAAIVAAAVLDAAEGKRHAALAALREVAASAAGPEAAAAAWMAIGDIERAAGAGEEAAAAYRSAAAAAWDEAVRAEAERSLAAVLAARAAEKRSVIHILPLQRQVVSGMQLVRTHLLSAAVSRVVFSVDGHEVRSVDRPPFSASIDFGAIPARRSILVTAFDRRGLELGRDVRIVNDGGEKFTLRLVQPAAGEAAGAVPVTLDVRVPVTHRVTRVVLSWNEAERKVLTAPPWNARVDIPSGELGVLRAVAVLDDGRESEDAVLLNAGGLGTQLRVQLLALPITIMDGSGAIPAIDRHRIKVREGSVLRPVESVATAAETPLTVGVMIDVSASMQKTLPDVQEAAIRFLESILGDRDRAFLVTFDSGARLLQAATPDVALLRRRVMSIRPDGLTALHDAMVLGLLQFEGVPGRRALVVFTDGVDRTSEYDAADVTELSRRVNVPVHVIAAPAWSPVPPSADALPGAGVTWVAEPVNRELERVAKSTGGTSNRLDNLRELPRVYASIGAALRAQVLAFIRTDAGTHDHEWRPIRVEVEGSPGSVFAPEGYYAPW